MFLEKLLENYQKSFVVKKKRPIFAPAIQALLQSAEGLRPKYGPFVYRLGRKIFILERGVRFSYGLLKIKNKHIGQQNGKSQISKKKDQAVQNASSYK